MRELTDQGSRTGRGTLVAVAVMLVFGLFFLWPIQGIPTARDVFFLASVTVMGLFFHRTRSAVALRAVRAPGVLYAALTVWLVIVALFVSGETVWSLDEIRRQWLRPMLAFVLGVLVAHAVMAGLLRQRVVVSVLVLGLFLHLLLYGADAVLSAANGGDWRRLATIVGGPDKESYLIGILLAFLLAEAVRRAIRERPFLPGTNVHLAAGLIAVLASVFLAGMRNGVLELAVVLICAAALLGQRLLGRIPRRIAVGALAAVLAVPVIALSISLKTDPRWNAVIETIPVALDTQTNKAWLDESKYGLPTLPDGRPVEASAYMRVAWYKEGAMLVLDRPLGVGYGRNSFGHGLRQKYGEGGGHSHSGLVDLAVGGGVPALVLWIAFLASLFAIGWRAFRANASFAAIALMLFVIGFSFRMLVDSNMRDHMLQQFMFLASLLAVLAARPTPDASAGSESDAR